MGTYLSVPKTEKETEFGTGKDVAYGMSGMQGWRRSMEDAHICVMKLNDDADMSLYGVFDGHGGAEVARFCAKHVAQELVKLKEFSTGDYDSALQAVFHHMDNLLRDESFYDEITELKNGGNKPNENKDEEEGSDPAIWERIAQLKRLMIEQQEDSKAVQAGCTAVVALKRGHTLYVANAGDSRGVLCRGGQAVALSEDHKPMLESERTRINQAGGSVTDVGGVPRVNGNLNLSRAIGDLKYKTNTNLPPEAQIITAQPDVRVFELTKEDKFFVLACDGVWDVMSNQECVNYVAQQLQNKVAPHEVASNLLDHCLAQDPKDSFGVGCDNMTCIIVVLSES